MTEPSPPARRLSTALAMVFMALMFFILGFVTWLNGSLIPYLKTLCQLSTFQALWVTFAFYIAYTVMALPSAAVLRRTGYKRGMVLSLGVMALGALCFIPAAYTAQYGLFLLALFTLASGMTLMQTAINPYIVCIGPRESAAMRISIMGLFNKGAGMVVPLVFTAWVLSGLPASEGLVADAAHRADMASRLVFPYLVMAAGLLIFMAVVHFSALGEPDLDEPGSEPAQASAGLSGVWQHPQAVLGALTLFAYVGVEVIAGDTIGLLGQAMGVAHYNLLTSYTMGFMVLGYSLGVVAIPRFCSQRNALVLSAALGLLCSLGVLWSSPQSQSLWSATLAWLGVPAVPDPVFWLALLGLANALVWPAVWPLALDGLGRQTANASALLIMGIAGGAVLPPVYGAWADASGHQSAYAVLLPCYALILLYALWAYRLRCWPARH
jgi:FHS family L-fucose permease-like MFS transporter